MDEKIAQIDKGKMKRVLGVPDLFAIGFGDLGSSIYYALGITAFYALGATPVALLLAGLVFVCTALTYAEMSSIIPDAGGSASYSRKAFNDLISFIAGWGLLLDYIVTIAISGFAAVAYLSYFFPYIEHVVPRLFTSTCVIMGMVFINIRGSKLSTGLSVVLTGLTLLTQVIIMAIAGYFFVDFANFFSHLKIGGSDVIWSPTWSNFGRGVAMAMVAYTGIESMAQLSSEAKNPGKTVPRAILITMVTLLVSYLGISLVGLSAMTPQELSGKYLDNPIAGMVAALPQGADILGPWVGLLAAVILIVAANAGLIGASRLAFNMGENFQIPRRLYALHRKYKTPYVALLIFGSLASLIVIASIGSLNFLADLYNFGAMVAFFSAHMSLIMHRIRYPDVERPFKVPLNIKIASRQIPITAVIGALSSAAVWVLIVFTKPDGRYLGLGWLVVGLIMYVLFRRRFKLSPTGSLEVEKVKVEEFQKIKIKKILLPTKGHLSPDSILISCHLAKAFNAEVTALHIVEVSYMLPVTTSLVEKDASSEAILNRMQAIGVEMGVKMKLRAIRSRSVVKTIIDLVENEQFDLLILGSRKADALGPITEKIMAHAKCRVWICKNLDSNASLDPTDLLYEKATAEE